jgi:hypothetical protein
MSQSESVFARRRRLRVEMSEPKKTKINADVGD